jgi:hypothetical protein
MWSRLEYERLSDSHEVDLQRVFDGWPEHVAGRASVCLAGVPRILGDVANRSRPRVAAFGYSFVPDALFERRDGGGQLVVELKRAAKYEPLALAEALHHAEFFSAHAEPNLPTTPVIVASFNCWTRLALAHLLRNGVAPDAIHYFEVDWLRTPDGGRRILWFDAPLGAIERVERSNLPACVPPETAERLVWHRSVATGAWIALSVEHSERPAIIEEPYVMVAPVGASGDRFVAWQGRHAPKGVAGRGEDSFFLWTAGSPGGDGPTW